MKNILLEIKFENLQCKPNRLKIDSLIENLLRNAIVELTEENKNDVLQYCIKLFCQKYGITDFEKFCHSRDIEKMDMKIALAYFLKNDLFFPIKKITKIMHKKIGTIGYYLRIYLNQESIKNDTVLDYYRFLKKIKYTYYKK